MIVVVARNYMDFKNYCREHRVSPNDYKQVRYVTKNSLRGLQLTKGDEIVKIPGWCLHPNVDEILEGLAILEATRR